MDGAVDEGWVETRVCELQRRARIPAVVAGVSHGGVVVATAAAGWADVAEARPVALDTPLRIGSITKTYTAAVVVDLAVRGLLDLDEPVGAYLPGVDLGRVRLRHLLAHTGGLQREVPGSMWATMRGPEVEELRAALGRAETVAEPGTRMQYSNLGYAVLGQVVAAVTGRDCRDVIDDHLIRPLGLASTTWQPPRQAAAGYRRDPYRDDVHPEPAMELGATAVAGDLWSTVGDLLVWGDVLCGGNPQVLAEAVVVAMRTPQVMVDLRAWTSGWGLGLCLSRRGERIVAGHEGGMPGFSAALSLDPSTRIVAVTLGNVTGGVEVLDLSFDLVEQAAQRAPQPPARQPWRPGQPCPAELDGVLGPWWSESAQTVFTWRDGRLRARLELGVPNAETVFERVGEDRYRAAQGRACGEYLTIERDPDGVVTGLVWVTYPYRRDPQ